MEVSSSDFFKSLRRIKQGEILSICRLIPPSSQALRGISHVNVIDDQAQSLTLVERGKWLSPISEEAEVVYTNALRFRLLENGIILLEHLRYGKNRPVQLLELHHIGFNHYKSLAPHMCEEDVYTGDLLFGPHFVQLGWRVTGPKKRMVMRTLYT